jgi:hypothetical protein
LVSSFPFQDNSGFRGSVRQPNRVDCENAERHKQVLQKFAVINPVLQNAHRLSGFITQRFDYLAAITQKPGHITMPNNYSQRFSNANCFVKANILKGRVLSL